MRQIHLYLTIILILSFGKELYGQSCTLKYDSLTQKAYYSTADKMPAYRGGLKALVKTIYKNLKWPGGFCCIDGSVFVSFIIEPDGKITRKKIVKGIASGRPCDVDGEALAVLDYLNEWIPGECNGVKVPVEIVLPIKFKLVD